MEPYDALLLVSFGGPEGPDDVLPFLENVTRGRDVPPQRLAEVGAHYHEFGGRSPINDQCRALRDAVSADLSTHGIELPVYWGNRNWHPYLADTLRTMRDDGIARAACLVTSAYSSYAGCRQYREDLFDAVVPLGGTLAGIDAGAPRLDRLRHFFNHPGFVQPFVDGTAAALRQLREHGSRAVRLVFVTHSIPVQMNAASGYTGSNAGGAYVRQHAEVARVVTDLAAEQVPWPSGEAPPPYDLVYCSRSGSPRVPWLEPDIADHLAHVAAAGTDAVVVVPIGFVSDHMEVVWDLDTEAAAAADRLGLGFARVPTPGTDQRFVAMVRDLLVERAAVERGADAPDRAVVGRLGPSWDACPDDCCANPRGGRPAVGGAPAD